ncbi:MAG: hypothetical protein ACFCUN_10620 [Hyphomicrobiaceae bacterium]
MQQRKTSQSSPETLGLETFLTRLEPEAAAAARSAAMRMDEIEREIAHLEDVELNFIWPLRVGIVTFLVGAAIILLPGETTAAIYRWLGPGLVVVMLGILPLSGLWYGWQVRERSRGDFNKIALNRKHFVPHGAYYFPSAGGAGHVVIVDFRDEKVPFSRFDYVRPGQLW